MYLKHAVIILLELLLGLLKLKHRVDIVFERFSANFLNCYVSVYMSSPPYIHTHEDILANTPKGFCHYPNKSFNDFTLY